MKTQLHTIETELKRELQELKVGHSEESALTWIKPKNVMHMDPADAEHLEQILKETLEYNDVWNGYAFVYNNEAAEHLMKWNQHRNCYNIDDAVSIAYEFGYTLEQIERTGFAILANIQANYTAELRDEDRIQEAAKRIFLILQTHKQQELEELEE